MKKLLKILGVIAAVVVVLVIAGLIYFNSTYPDVDPPRNIKVEATSEKLAHGEYLANHVALCIDCHSERDWTKFAGPIVPGTEGEGGENFGPALGLPGDVYAKNITPAAIGNWTDGELIRAIVQGVNKDGEALFPIMPYPNFNHLSNDDLEAIVAYLRTLEPVENEVPETNLNFPVNFIVKTIPIKDYTPSGPIDKSNSVDYGKYLVTIASCADCHTPAEQGEPVPGMEFAGGQKFNLPWGMVQSSNITPDPETGIGSWTKENFINTFKRFDPDSSEYIPVDENSFNTIMPWIMYAGMKEEDLAAIYDYLMTVKPVKNLVAKYTPLEAKK